MTFQDQIEKAVLERFKSNPLGLEIDWERCEAYAIDDACRTKASALGMVDQGRRFNDSNSGCTDVTWRLAVEFFVRCNRDEDIKSQVNLALACVHRTMMADQSLGNLLIDTKAVEDMTFVDRAQNAGEGVMTFDLRYRTKVNDISRDFYS